MLHVSTRGEAPALSFSDALLAGLARDGGLYVPKAWPTLTPDEIAGFSGQSYAQVAERILSALADGDVEGTAGFAVGEQLHGRPADFAAECEQDGYGIEGRIGRRGNRGGG